MKDIIDAIASMCPDFSLSLKIRSGFESFKESEEILPAICTDKVDFVMYHFRTVTESYKKIENPYLRTKRAVELAGSVPLIGSGDIFSVDDAINMLETSGCAGITVARGLFKSPLLIRNIESQLKVEPLNYDSRGQEKFFNLMLKMASEDPANFWRKTFFIELAIAMWGRKHPNFDKVIKLDEPQPVFNV